MKKLLRWSTLLMATVCCLAPISANALELNGIDTYHHMGKDYYWVAFYTAESCHSSEQCQTGNSSQRFQLKVITERWTAQSFNLVWQRDLASNNQILPADLNMDSVIHFTQLPKTGLTYGDAIDISYDGHDTTIAINQVFALRSPSKALFNYLSNVWLGPVPPSRSFRANMLTGHAGEHNEKLISDFENLKPTRERMALLSEWINTEPVASQKPAPKINTAKSLPKPTAEPAIAASAHVDATEKTSNTAKEQITRAKKTKNKQLPENQSLKPKAVQKRSPKPANNNEPSIEEAYAIYRWQLFKAICEQVKYPSWAKQLSQEGVVSIDFELDDDYQLSTIHGTEPTYAGLLADALTQALQNATLPRPSWPHLINREQRPLRFNYEHQFQLRAAAPIPSLEPHLAAYLQNDLTATDSSAPITDEALTQHLASFIEYPYWAKKMRLKGKVSIELTLARNGQIQKADLIKKSRHPELDAALLEAAENAAPYPVFIPAGETRTLIYEHRFKP